HQGPQERMAREREVEGGFQSGPVESSRESHGRTAHGRVSGTIVQQHVLFERRKRERKEARRLAISVRRFREQRMGWWRGSFRHNTGPPRQAPRLDAGKDGTAAKPEYLTSYAEYVNCADGSGECIMLASGGGGKRGASATRSGG